ncbi:electron transfer flavoprotein subunit alpha/FixB family protein [Candidatus Bathyarchaeota archaeon]|nr:electron transfer flavoprotein subunit alpha/FixB family protein [Candidatus Bathyarchaeota archaeon]
MYGILVVAEHRKGRIRDQTLNCLGKAIELGKRYNFKVSCAILGYGIKELAEQLSTYADTVFSINDKNFGLYSNELYKKQISDLIEDIRPKLVLMGQTALAMDLMPGLSAKLDLPLITDCIDIWFEDDKLMALRYMYEGRVKATISLSRSSTYLATLRAGVQPETSDKRGRVIEAKPTFEIEMKSKSIELVEPEKEDLDISKSEIVVGVGLGITSKENIKLVEDLANLLGGALGCTRPIVDRKWLPQTRQIGFSGRSIKSKIYIAVGLSGSTHHIKGIEGVKKIIAINKDAGAPIFNYADYGVIGDLFDILPPLINRLKELRAVR